MSSKKNIDRLFQEQFKNFEATPDAHVWQHIEQKLNKQKRSKKRFLPLWWKAGSAAAILLIMFAVGYSLLDSSSNSIPNTPTITNTDAQPENNSNNTEETINNSKSNIIKEVDNKIIHQSKNKSGVAQKKTPIQNNSKNTVTKTNNSLLAKNIQTPDTKTSQKNNPITNPNTTGESVEASTTSQQNAVSNSKKSLLEIVNEQQSLEEDDAKKLANSKKWSINPTVAPVYFNAFGSGSPIDASFVDNSKSGNVNLSYGVNVAYQVSKRLSVRSGINKVDFGYTTNNITFSPSVQALGYDFVTPSGDVPIQVFDSNEKAPLNGNSEFSARSAQFTGEMVQRLGYIEVPLEAKYSLINKKIGVSLVGGISSLFLTNNSVTLTSENITTMLGKANNVNSINFSTNIGLGIDYKFSESLLLNIEPMFKYQLNTFSNEIGSFSPYSLGIYTGFSFRF